MIACCSNCDYVSNEEHSLDRLKKVIQKDGGYYIYGDSTCPKCKSKDKLRIN
jgi:hypothetical protein